MASESCLVFSKFIMKKAVAIGTASLILASCVNPITTQIQIQVPKDIVEYQQIEYNSINQVIASSVLLETKNYYEQGSATLIETRYVMGVTYGDYVLTVEHGVSHPHPLYIRSGKIFVPIQREPDKTETKIADTLSPLEKIVGEDASDVAVFKLGDYNGYKFPFELNEMPLVGQPVLLIGNPGLQGFTTREGIISNVSDMLWITPLVIPGDSGSPVVDRNTFQLVGLVSGKWNEYFTRIVPIEHYKPYLK